jgi:hypothetical protein
MPTHFRNKMPSRAINTHIEDRAIRIHASTQSTHEGRNRRHATEIRPITTANISDIKTTLTIMNTLGDTTLENWNIRY